MAPPAPLFAEMADGPEGGRAWWVSASDGVRLRLAAWQRPQARGTVLLVPGRTEYIEKYGRAAGELARRGLATLVIDLRGQGLAERLSDDPMLGHVGHFSDYQRDMAAMIATARAQALPRPWYLLAHSMGGCIGLRAAIEGLEVAGCVFSAPMWGIHMRPALRPFAWAMGWAGVHLGLGEHYAPGSGVGAQSYVLSAPFETNLLTRDREMYAWMIAHLRRHPELGLGGPSLRWLIEALTETRRLARCPAPALPCLTLMGTQEEIVDPDRIRARMRRWPGGRLEIIPGARHEVMMEDDATRARVFDMIGDFCAEAVR